MPYRRKKLTFAISSPDEFLYYKFTIESFSEKNEKRRTFDEVMGKRIVLVFRLTVDNDSFSSHPVHA